MDELTYEPAETQVQAVRHPGVARNVMAGAGDITTDAGNSLVESVAISPLTGAILPATADTAARARAGKAAKREALRQAALSGMLTAAQAVAAGVYTEEQAWGKIIEGQTELALSPDLRGSTQAAALVGKAIGATERERDDAGGGNSVVINLSDAAVAQIALALAGKLDGDE